MIHMYNDMQRGKTSKVPLLFELAPSANISMHDDELSMQTIEASSFKDAIARVELVSKELNHFGVIAGLFRRIGGHSSRFVLFCSF